ncbi:hypothetical protein NLU13_5317 [Sarocladium strictum]|uniref:Uncharacterized protein n=1 Tax=Sarocladium strictum TaxID=5046 RepID=A0AA39L7I0_SARSR|nr:hypothetical protein NLU13_5317 [Sarocladium strictum]
MERDNSESSGSSWTPETKRKAGGNKEVCMPLRNKRIKIEDFETPEVSCGPDDRNPEPAAVMTTVDGPLHNASPRNEKTIRYIGKDVTRPQDLALLVGPEKVEIRVHLVMLEARCPQMLQQAIPDAMNGHIQGQGSMRVLLPEDDPDATFTFLVLTCSGVEDRSKALSNLGSGQFAVVSMVARKYRCDALLLDLYLNMFSMHQAEGLPPAEREFADLWNAALSAYWLRSPTCFERLTCCLIQKQRSENASFLHLVQASPDKELAWKLSCVSQ